MRSRTLLAAVALVVGFVSVNVAPADARPAHFMAAGVVTQDGFIGECRVDAVYGTFGNGFAQITLRATEDEDCALSTTVEVTTAFNGQVRGQSCSIASAIDFPSPSCVLSITPLISLRAVAPGAAFSMRTFIRTRDGRQSIETHGAFG